MKSGIFRAFFSIGLLLCCLLTTAYASGRNHSDFVSMPLPAPHTLESAIGFGEDQNGQVWLVTEFGISVFRDGAFQAIRRFNLSDPILSFVISGDTLYLANQNSVLAVSLVSPFKTPLTIWESNSQEVVREIQYSHQSEADSNGGVVWLRTNRGLYLLSEPRSLTASQNWQSVFGYNQESQLVLHANESGLHFYTNGKLHFYALADGGLESSQMQLNIKQLATEAGSLIALTDNRLIQFSADLEQSSTFDVDVDVNSTLVQGRQRVFLSHAGELKSVTNETELTNSKQAANTFIDSNDNVWQTTEFDIRAAWYQSIPVEEVLAPAWGNSESLGLVSDGYWSVADGMLAQLNEQGQVERRWKLELADGDNWQSVTQVWSQGTFVWLKSDRYLYAVDSRTGLNRVELGLTATSLALPYLQEQALVISPEQLFVVNGSGSIQLLRDATTCGAKCLPEYKVYYPLIDASGVWLATNQGLHRFSFENSQFSQSRLDYLNSVGPIIYIAKATSTKLWLVYPNKVALFDTTNGTSEIFYSPNNRIFEARLEGNSQLTLNSQLGWFQLSPNARQIDNTAQVVVQRQVDGIVENDFTGVERELELSSNVSQLHLAFFMATHHPAQAFSVQYKYAGEVNWSQASNVRADLTLKDLKQGHNELMVQARLEGKNWQDVKSIRYFLPYRFFQTKWVLAFVALFLLILLGVVAYERMRRINVVFKSLKQQAFISSLLESTREGVWIADKDRNIQSVNQAFVEITGFQEKDVKGAHFQLLTDSGRNHEVESLIWQEVIKHGYWSGEVWSKQADGEKLSIDLSVTRVESEDKVLGKSDVKFVGVFSDVTSRKQNESELRHLATRDSLTNLANRTLFIEHVKHSINTATNLNPHFAVMFIDLDNFKKVNESLGLLQGDELIKLVGERIQGVLEKGVSLARLGGDEFALLVPNHLLSGVPAFYIKRVAADIQRVLQSSFQLGTTEVNITTSMGVAIYPNHGEKVEFLMRCADTALNRAKESGRNNCLVYDHIMDDVASDKLSLESELISALNNDEFLVYYQPKYRIKENQISGFEALVRWQNPNRGLVPPDQFISIAEENGLIRQLDSCVLRQVCAQIKEWKELGLMPGKVAVNISALNFQQADFCEHILKLVEQEGASTQHIELEITETAMMQNPEKALASIETLRNYGFSIALDDFGTGHSSLGYLKSFPIDRIKIDRTFVKEIEISSQDRNITSVIVQLARHLDKAVIAEGIENEQQAYLLHVMGCNEIQGYFISRPIPAEQVPNFLLEEMKKIKHIVGE